MKENEFLNLINKHSGIIHKVLFLYVDDPEDRRDLKQEIILQSWKSVHSFQGKSSFSTWLYRVAFNTALTYRRKDKAKQKVGIDEYTEPANIPSVDHKSDLLFRAIKGLSDIDKTIVTLHLEDYDNQEISEITGMTKNNVAVKLHRIKEHLSRLLNPASNG